MEELVRKMWQQCKTTGTVRLNWCRSYCSVVISLISVSGGKVMKRRPSISQYSEEYHSDGEPTARKEYASPPPPYRSDIISGSIITASSCRSNTKLLFCIVIFFKDQTIFPKYVLVVWYSFIAISVLEFFSSNCCKYWSLSDILFQLVMNYKFLEILVGSAFFTQLIQAIANFQIFVL